ncbi:hypothetical protein LRB59_03565 [Borreliella burgdorferi]|uniref:Uncharacterized protein BB_0097 n=5 Tax=Borreliella burgdorferi TaxID=139 RepID=Y097_BORBU|nr:hypothetical protein [Borreliella burgdorferi]O51124.1 RecName: Full=Uncharacterized protein BB_0097 [Borreliella burgdorferi B31]AGS66120.1 hypothetical protein L144_00485 [Borreliella burgdorferi CA382]EOA80553.1 hypothetical protein BBUCA8_00480 [Borreliella burgdorferi CA8]MCR8909361.1 hypothetical protein [Borreliella burgdorferi 297]AAC66488.1 conserved hypothetical protein [Borreliella burgdorferi B31]ACK74614.1 conserved hypothetical protein [Borreliella burgdorferi ZS7]
MNISKFNEFENVLFHICLDVDFVLENEFGNSYDIHPNRPFRGKAANGLLDGLFSVTTTFTSGYGSRFGRGYLIIIEILTLNFVDDEFWDKINKRGIEIFREGLKNKFPSKNLDIVLDGNVYKIIGPFF